MSEPEPTPSALDRLAAAAPSILIDGTGGLIGSYAGAGLGIAFGGPEAGVVGGAAGAFLGNATGNLIDAVSDVVRAAWHHRARRGADAITLAAAELGLTPEELMEQAQVDPGRLELLALVFSAAGETTLENKVRALAGALAAGFIGKRTDDHAKALIRALTAMERPEIRVLAYIAEHTYTTWKRPHVAYVFSRPGVQPSAMRGFLFDVDDMLVQGAFTVLAAHDLIVLQEQDEAIPMPGMNRYPDTGQLTKYELTKLGVECLRLLGADLATWDKQNESKFSAIHERFLASDLGQIMASLQAAERQAEAIAETYFHEELADQLRLLLRDLSLKYRSEIWGGLET